MIEIRKFEPDDTDAAINTRSNINIFLYFP